MGWTLLHLKGQGRNILHNYIYNFCTPLCHSNIGVWLHGAIKTWLHVINDNAKLDSDTGVFCTCEYLVEF